MAGGTRLRLGPRIPPSGLPATSPPPRVEKAFSATERHPSRRSLFHLAGPPRRIRESPGVPRQGSPIQGLPNGPHPINILFVYINIYNFDSLCAGSRRHAASHGLAV